MERGLWDGQGEKKVDLNRFTGDDGRRFFCVFGGMLGIGMDEQRKQNFQGFDSRFTLI
jgi:hypothetical protein